MSRKDILWKNPAFVKKYLYGFRGGIPFTKEHANILLRLVENIGKPVRSFLDIGCGNGLFAGVILLDFPEAEGVLIDFYQPMLEEAMSMLKEYEKLHFINDDISRKKWMDSAHHYAPYDVIVSGITFHHQSDKRKAELYKEINSLLSPGGLFVNIDQVKPPSLRLHEVSTEHFIETLITYHDKKGDPISRKEALSYIHDIAEKDNILADVFKQCEWLKKAGFTDVDVYFKAFEGAMFGGRKKE